MRTGLRLADPRRRQNAIKPVKDAPSLTLSGQMPRLNLRNLILLLALAAALVTLVNGFLVTYTVQKATLVDNALAANRAYAAKLAESIDDSLAADLDRLAFSAGLIGQAFGDRARMSSEARRLLRQDRSFNTLLIADQDGTVLVTEPQALNIAGQKMRYQDALRERRALVSPAFESIAGNLIVFVSQPIRGAEGEYLGLIGGAIHLGKPNALHSLIGRHFHRDTSSVYLVDQSRRLIYHSDPTRIGEHIHQNAIIDAVLRGESGAMQARNSRGVDMLAGYASVPRSRWGVVVQQPLQLTLDTLQALMYKLAIGMLPMGLLGFALVWWIASRLSLPLQQLADYARRLDTPDNVERIEKVSGWYYEAWRVRRALLAGVLLLQERIGQLNVQAQSDALTGLANRRALEDTLALWRGAGKPFAALAVDIDHFKQVNDSHGHDVGDLTLQAVARLMRQCLRNVDLPCRIGGEEFLVLLPGASPRIATEVAERIRSSIASTPFQTVGQVTVSVGVAHWHVDSEQIATTLKRADELLYAAKQAGRNRVMVEQRGSLASVEPA